MIAIESGRSSAAYVADLIPTAAHAPDTWIPALDSYPLDSLAARKRFAAEAVERGTLVFFEHDPAVAAGYFHDTGGKRTVAPAPHPQS